MEAGKANRILQDLDFSCKALVHLDLTLRNDLDGSDSAGALVGGLHHTAICSFS